MPGNETHGFDMAIEFAEEFYEGLIGVFLQDGDLICPVIDLLNLLPGIDLSCDQFQATVSLDRPTDVPLPAGAENPIDIRLALQEADSEPGVFSAELRIVVGVDVDRSDPSRNVVQIDFPEKLYFARLEFGGVDFDDIPLLGSLREQLAKLLPALPVLPVGIQPGDDDPTHINRLDFRIVDDTSPEDRDATAGLLTFGGGTSGDAAAFQRSFVAPGQLGAIAASFEWICRVLDVQVRQALHVDEDTFRDCTLQHAIRIDDDEEVDLTKLEIRLEDGFLALHAQVRKSGFCYEATGDVGGRIMLQVVGGVLTAQVHVDDPDIDLDVPWYCWVVGALVALLAGALFGVIGLVVAVVVEVVVYLLIQTVEAVVQAAAQMIVDALNAIAPSFSIEISPIDAFIDDVTIGLRMAVRSHAAVRSEGVLLVRDGQTVDLDQGRVGGEDLAGADLLLERSGGRRLRTVCRSGLTRTGQRDFDAADRYVLGTLRYRSPEQIPESELALHIPLGFLFGDDWLELDYVYGVHTDEARFAAVQVVEVEDQAIRIRYRTYEKRLPEVRILGEFRCERPFLPVKPEAVDFVPSKLWTPGAPPAGPGGGAGDPCAGLLRAARAELPRDAVVRERIERASPGERRLGTWLARYRAQAQEVGRFEAAARGLSHPLSFAWAVDGTRLEDAQGVVTVRGAEVGYRVHGRHLTLSPRTDRELEIELAVAVHGAHEASVRTSRCVRFRPSCPREDRAIPDFRTYHAAYQRIFGSGEIPEAGKAKVAFGGPLSRA